MHPACFSIPKTAGGKSKIPYYEDWISWWQLLVFASASIKVSFFSFVISVVFLVSHYVIIFDVHFASCFVAHVFKAVVFTGEQDAILKLQSDGIGSKVFEPDLCSSAACIMQTKGMVTRA